MIIIIGFWQTWPFLGREGIEQGLWELMIVNSTSDSKAFMLSKKEFLFGFWLCVEQRSSGAVNLYLGSNPNELQTGSTQS